MRDFASHTIRVLSEMSISKPSIMSLLVPASRITCFIVAASRASPQCVRSAVNVVIPTLIVEIDVGNLFQTTARGNMGTRTSLNIAYSSNGSCGP